MGELWSMIRAGIRRVRSARNTGAHPPSTRTSSAVAGWWNGPLIRQLRHEPWFAAAAAGLLFILLTTAAGLPRIWRTTPTGFLPEIRISGFDRIEVFVESRLAAACERRGDLAGACLHRRAAASADPGNLDALRRLLKAEAQRPTMALQKTPSLAGEIRWLLALGGTNHADLELGVRVAGRARNESLLGTLLRPVGEEAPASVRREKAKWLLRSGDFEGFGRVARRMSPAESEHDAEWMLYRLGWTAAHDDPAHARAAVEELEAASQRGSTTPEERDLALRLRFLVALTRNDPAAAGSLLGRLRDVAADLPGDHARFWEQLTRLGRAEEARRLAGAYADPPAGSVEMERIGTALTGLGLWDEAIDFYFRCLQRREGRGRVWVACGSALVRRERWRDVRELASRMRGHPDDAASWVGYSRYLDGVAFLGLGRTNEAIGEFRRLLETPYCDPRAALAVGADLVQRRFPEVAAGLLHRREPEFAGFPEFWRILVRAAVQQGDAELMLNAARREWALDGQGVEAANDLAVALLLTGREPGLARQLTRRVLDADPESASAMIHHSLALLGDGLPRAARPLLESIDATALSATQQNSLAYARALLAARENRLADLAIQLRNLHPAWLFPGQQAEAEALWLRVAASPPAPR
jgi:tetratricopeptide (TPR) repeat protein